MRWTKLEQETNLLQLAESGLRKKIEGALYKDRLLLLGDGKTPTNSETERLCCWNPGICYLILK